MSTGTGDLETTINKIRQRFAYPVELVRRSDRDLPPPMVDRLDRGEAVYQRGRILVAMTNADRLMEFGPLPQFAGPTLRDVLIGLGSVFLLVAVAIAFLLRPIARQFRTVERTAIAITSGDLSARIDGGKKRSLPIVTAFNEMADRVESLLRSQRELLQAVSHELRTPLARIKFATELVRSAKDDQTRQKRIDSIDDATDQLNSLVGELLDYTRHDSGGEAVEQQVFNVHELIEEIVQIQAPLHCDIGFEIGQSDRQQEIDTNRAALHRAIGNLISNAGKYARSRVVIDVSTDEGAVVIAIADDGAGISGKDQELIFEPFKRLQANKQPGTGLGLALVRRICQRLGGEVSVGESELGGARFVIRLTKVKGQPQSHG